MNAGLESESLGVLVPFLCRLTCLFPLVTENLIVKGSGGISMDSPRLCFNLRPAASGESLGLPSLLLYPVSAGKPFWDDRCSPSWGRFPTPSLPHPTPVWVDSHSCCHPQLLHLSRRISCTSRLRTVRFVS